MNVEIKPMQHLLLWRLAVGSGGDFLGKLPAFVTAPQRKALIKAGLISEDKRINPNAKSKRKVAFLSLTEEGWAWCQKNMIWPRTASKKDYFVLELLLPRLRRTIENAESIHSLGDFINKSTSNGPPPTPEPSAKMSTHQAIRDACRALGDGKEGIRLRIADVRGRINGFSKEEVTEAFWDLSKKGEISLYHMDDPKEVQPDDRDAAVITSTGEEKHIVYFGGKAS